MKANERFSRIALEAVKQCGRSQKIRIDMPISFDELIVQISRHQKAIFAYEASDGDLKELCIRDRFGEVVREALVTENEVKAAYDDGSMRVLCEKDAIITPLARDKANELGVSIDF